LTFAPIFAPDDLLDAVSDPAWVEAMLEAERALAAAEAAAGVIPAGAAIEIAEASRAAAFDPAALAEQGRKVGNPAEPLVRALRAAVGGEAASYVHWGATSQDIVDTAAMLVARRALGLIDGHLEGVADACARLADEHRATPMAARTLLQQAVPTTFGLKAAGWLVAVDEARAALGAVPLAAQLGGAAGTLAAIGDGGLEVAALYAKELDLPEPVLPWHTNRTRIASLGAALAEAAGVLAKVALDVVLLSQTEVGEVAEPAGGGSSTMPQKRNPVGSTLAIACERRVRAAAFVLSESLVGEHERAAGAWQAEWGALSDGLAFTGGAAASLRRVLEGLEVDADRMRANLARETVAERLAFALAGRHGREEAHHLVAERDWAELDVPEELLDPTTYTGSAEALVERALDHHRKERR
jgi:3-carboxy-cis,cis-muconate cycloisomerase